jgi:ATP-dependent protease La (LON) substrate-binding domain
MAKTRFLPMFPLKLVVFPSEKLNLHVFEPRYKQLILECQAENKTFGIPAFIDSKLMEIGTEIRLINIEKQYEDGKMDVCTEGVGLFKVVDFYTQAVGKMYGAADVLTLNLKNVQGSYLKNEEILGKTGELFRLLNVKKELPFNSVDFKTYQLAHYVGFTIEQEYQFLCLNNELERQDFMFDHLTRILPVVREMEFLRQRALLNGHFKNIVPPKF